MSQFLTSNRRGGLLGLLPPFLRTGTGLMLIGVLALASFLFVAPAGMTVKAVQFVQGLFRRGSKDSLSQLFAAIKAQGEKKQPPPPWASLYGGIGRLSAAGAASSVGMIKGKPEDLAEVDVTSKLGERTTVKGILTPEDARKRGAGVSVSPDEVGGEREGLALAARAADLGASGAYAGRALFSGAGAAAQNGDRLKTALQSAEVPGVQGAYQSPSPGRIPKAKALELRDSGLQAAEANRTEGANVALTQLGEGQLRVASAKTEPSHEGASAAAGTLYDGSRLEKPRALDAATAPRFDGASIPRIPDGKEYKKKEEPAPPPAPARGGKRAAYGKKLKVHE